MDREIGLCLAGDHLGMSGNLSGSFVFSECCDDVLDELEELNFLVNGTPGFLEAKHHMRSVSRALHFPKRDVVLGGMDKDSARCNFHRTNLLNSFSKGRKNSADWVGNEPCRRFQESQNGDTMPTAQLKGSHRVCDRRRC